MNILKLLTYNIREHNIICFNDAFYSKEAPSFARSLFRRVRRAFHMHAFSYAMKQNNTPFYTLCEPLKHVVFAPISNNNKRSLEPIWDRYEGEYSILYPSNDNYIPTKLIYFYSLLYIWPLLWCYFKANQNEKLIIRSSFDDFFETIGFVIVLDKLLKHSDVKLIVLANDHCALPRALVKVSKQIGIKTMYLQHCTVAETFPRLQFDYSFLDGEESYLKYLTIGKPDGVVYLAGNPRFDVITRYRSKVKQRHSIGIATNLLDNEEKVRNLCLQLQSLGYTDITIRPHPDTQFNPKWYIEHNIAFSNSNIENPFEFISRMSIVIAGECGIHLDAAMMETHSICYNMIDDTISARDIYSYIKNGLVPYASNIEELHCLLQVKDEDVHVRIRKKAKWYNAAFGTAYEGHIGELLADFIRFEQAGDIAGFDKKYGFIMGNTGDYKAFPEKELSEK